MSLADLAQLVSAIAAFGALVAAVIQIRGLRRDAIDGRAGEILGVAVETEVVHRPVGADRPGGRSLWEYRFTVHNPGRFPITMVAVRVNFTIDQQRLHYEGSLDSPANHLQMNTPVVPAGGSKEWTRRIIIDHANHKRLRETVSTVEFVAPDAGRCKTTWPDPSLKIHGNRRLLRAIRTATA